MSIIVRLDTDDESPTGDASEIVVKYHISATAGEFASLRFPGQLARSYLTSNMQTVYDGREYDRAIVTRRGPDTFEGLVTYKTRDWEYQFDISTQDTLVTRSLDTISQNVRSGTAANYNRLIGVTRDGVEGTSIPIAIPSFNLTGSFGRNEIDLNYQKLLESLVAKQNNATFLGRDRGSVLFAGASGGIARGSTRWTLNYKFLVSQKVSGLNIDGITVSEKLGWDYLWAANVEWPDPSAFRLVRRIVQINVERVIEMADFSQLKIPAASL